AALGTPWFVFLTVFCTGARARAGAGGDRLPRAGVPRSRAHARTRRRKLGAVENLTPDQARKAATKVLAKVDLGGDPQADKKDRRQKDVHRLLGVIGQYLSAKESASKQYRALRPHTLHEIRRYLTGSYFKPLHVMPIDRITRRDVATRLLTITAEHGAPTAARARSSLSAVFVWAMGAGLVDANPVIGT